MINVNDLLLNGYFPKELPKVFNTTSYTNLITTNAIDLSQYAINKSNLIKFNIPKIKNFTRTISIPNPLHQTLLVNEIVSSWDEINNFLDTSQFSRSKIVPDTSNKRAITESSSFESYLKENIMISSEFKFMVSIDISKFYNTIYTHSLPWAIHTKETAKRVRGNSLVGNRLDRLLRNTQDQQTLGIPTGPDSSRILSEIIATAIDIELNNKISNLTGIRYIDDFYFYTDTLDQAEDVITTINLILKDYELEVNESKTSITSLPVSLEPLWQHELKTFTIRSTEEKQYNDLMHYFGKSFENYKKYQDKNILHYAVIQLLPLKIYQNNWDIFESFLLHAVNAEPKIIPIVAKLLTSYYSFGYQLNNQKIQINLNKFIKRHINLNRGFEVIWGITLLSELNLTINIEQNYLEKIKDPISMLSILVGRSAGVVTGDNPQTIWQNLIVAEELYGSHWLLAYESVYNNYLNHARGEDIISRDPFFSMLQKNDISFINSNHKIDKLVEDRLSYEYSFELEANISELLYGR